MDSTNETEPSGEMPVSRLMIQHIEPLLQVRYFNYYCYNGLAVDNDTNVSSPEI